MRKEKAIEIIKTAFEVWENEFYDGKDWEEEHKARDMAISALSEEELPTIPQTDSVLEDIKAEIDKESIGYPPSADYYKAIKKAVRIVEKHISRKE